MIILNLEKILKEQGKSKSWLCDQLDISFYNLNKAIKPGKKSISYKYLEGFCKALNCSFDELMTIVDDDDKL
ncbi:MAG: helix-turn-helix transcriptional regulator [Clostridia bacterium]|nr:helix-turn-helix transcriptional regulator [Clostridia bacterium]